MNLNDLRHLLAFVPAERLGRLFDQHRAAGGAEHIDAFLDFLLERGVIDGPTYRALNEPTHVGISDQPDEIGVTGPQGSPRTRFEIRGLLGRGAMGEVRVARDLGLFRNVAYKTMGTRYTGAQIEKRFLAEARITAQLDHPNIVPVHALERTDTGEPAYAMRLVQGRTFRQLFDDARAEARRGRPDREHRLATRLEHFLKVCDAIAYAHSKGVLHRDLKPANVMVGRFREVYVMDWGLAKLLGRAEPAHEDGSGHHTSRVQITAEGETGYERTRMGQIVGTLAYMAPEQALGEVDDVGPATDQFALGLMLYEVLTLRHPYLGDDLSAAPPWLGDRVRQARLLPIDTRRVGERVPPELIAVLRRATARAVPDRYPSVEELAADIRRIQRDEAPHAIPDNALRAARRWIRHNTVIAASAAAAVLFGSVGATGYVLRGQQVELAEQRAVLERELKIASERMAAVGSIASQIDNDFLYYEGTLEGLSASTLHALLHGAPSPAPLLHYSTLQDPAGSTGTLVRGTDYRDPVSLHHPMWAEAPGVTSDQVAPFLGKLSTLRGRMRQALFSTPSGATTSLDERVLPLQWVAVALESPGLIVIYPGVAGDLDPTYDPRDRPWYRGAIGTSGRHWGTPFEDTLGGGLVLPCASALYDERGLFLGVAGIGLRLEKLVETWLRPLGDPSGPIALPDFQAATLLDDEGDLLLHVDAAGAVLAGVAGLTDATPRGEFALPAEILHGIDETATGTTTTHDTAWTWSRLEHLGWTLVVEFVPERPLERL